MPNTSVIFLGKFQPPHLGHIQAIRELLKLYKHIYVYIGSSNRWPLTADHMFTAAEIEVLFSSLIYQELGLASLERVSFIPIRDFPIVTEQAWQLWARQFPRGTAFSVAKSDKNYRLNHLDKLIELNDLASASVFFSRSEISGESIRRALLQEDHEYLLAVYNRTEYDHFLRTLVGFYRQRQSFLAHPIIHHSSYRKVLLAPILGDLIGLQCMPSSIGGGWSLPEMLVKISDPMMPPVLDVVAGFAASLRLKSESVRLLLHPTTELVDHRSHIVETSVYSVVAEEPLQSFTWFDKHAIMDGVLKMPDLQDTLLMQLL